ncbi:MAG: YqeG family HAD IIIA-type phosphatase [Clostridia bacterium]|nr:YqeG family HAD IIIA-type phosphatase [Clostridia bacterium]
MAFSLIPRQVYRSIFEISPKALAAAGIRLLLADLDNTLVPYGVPTATAEVRAWNEELRSHGVTLFVLSNNRSATRAKRFSEDLGVPFLGHAGKPKAASFHKAMEQMSCTPGETAMVGDQLFTDILGANNAGVAALAVKPIAWGRNPMRIVRYGAEIPFRAIGKRRNKRL